MTPSNTPLHYPNTSINIAEMYGGMTEEPTLVQTNFEHEHDPEDIMPEFTENVVVEQKQAAVDSRKTDFQGEKYEEFYDE